MIVIYVVIFSTIIDDETMLEWICFMDEANCRYFKRYVYASPGVLWVRPAGIFSTRWSRPCTIKMKLDYFYIHFEDWVALECRLGWSLYSPSLHVTTFCGGI
jgi:hypothetical protein